MDAVERGSDETQEDTFERNMALIRSRRNEILATPIDKVGDDAALPEVQRENVNPLAIDSRAARLASNAAKPQVKRCRERRTCRSRNTGKGA